MKTKCNHKITLQMALMSILITFCSFSFLQQGNEWNAPESAKKIANPVPSNEVSVAAGKKIYIKECLSCHGKKGKGDGPSVATLEKSPGDLTSAKVQLHTDGELFWKISEGRKPMPSTKKTLTEEQRWQVVNYVRTLKK